MIRIEWRNSLWIGQLDRRSRKKKGLEQHYKPTKLTDIYRTFHSITTEYTWHIL